MTSPSAASEPMANPAILPPDPTNPAVHCQCGPCRRSVNAHTSSEGVDKAQEHRTAPESVSPLSPINKVIQTETSSAAPPSHSSPREGIHTVSGVSSVTAISTNLQEHHVSPGKSAPLAAVPPSDGSRYASTGIPTHPGKQAGWPAVEEALTKFDHQEIGGYKEDVDTLLTFTGLYSAVLTAFVIISYPQLQEDTAGETLQVLRIIANQTAGYAIVGGQLLNSTTASPALSPPFQPSPTAIRVNVLWFSSLVISLSTASLGILVKQWLRAYMAFCTSSPQGQLRVRQFRRSGLESWQVFGIASLLPLLIQISLSLFFVGLCYFTIDIHPTIGRTTIPLVCVWGLFITTVTLSPIFSSRCPYKTPALAIVTTVLRTRVYLPAASILVEFVPAVGMGLLKMVVFHFYFAVVYPIVTVWTMLLSHNPTSLYEAMESYHMRARYRFHRMMDYFIPGHHRFFTFVASREEAQIITDVSKDLDILVSADALQANDELLGTTVKVALEQSTPSWEDIVKFLVKIIGNRVPWTNTLSDEATLVDCELLSGHARKAVQDLFEIHVASSVEKLEGEDMSNNVTWAICLLVSLYEPGAQILTNQGRFVTNWLQNQADWACGFVVNDDFGKQMLPLVCQICRHREEMGFREKVDWVERALSMSPLRGWPDVSGNSTRVSVVEETARCFVDVLRSDGDSLPYDDRVSGLAIVMKLSAVVDADPIQANSWADQLYRSTSTPVKTCMTAISQVFDSWVRHHPTFVLKHILIFAKALLPHTKSDSIGEVPATLLSNVQLISISIIEPRSSSHYRDSRVGLEFFHLCHLTLHIRHACKPPNATQHHEQSLHHEWRRTFDFLAYIVSSETVVVDLSSGNFVFDGVYVISAEEIQDSLNQCWDLIDSIDDGLCLHGSSSNTAGQYDNWVRTFNEQNSGVGDYFCLVLNSMQEAPNRWRMRRLNAMTPEQREAIEDDGRREGEAIEQRVQRSLGLA